MTFIDFMTFMYWFGIVCFIIEATILVAFLSHKLGKYIISKIITKLNRKNAKV
jgi:hypothetical protein